ncbi:hypothetical protein B0H13DRAFT_1859711 [Mycena leptocephala]|nr:hypothetical protein B0H13DRAFT_1859711 [Mycena leptocephala]
MTISGWKENAAKFEELMVREGIPSLSVNDPKCSIQPSRLPTDSKRVEQDRTQDGCKSSVDWSTTRLNRIPQFFPSIRELSQSLAVLSAWQTLALPMIGKIETQYETASIPNELILSEDEIRRLTVRKIDEQLDKHRTLWRAGMTLIPRNYRLKTKAAKLGALQIAVAEHLRNMHQGSDMDGSNTLGADSTRQSAQMLDVMGFDELKSERAAVRRGLRRLIPESYEV